MYDAVTPTAFDEITGAEVVHAGRIQRRLGQCMMPTMIFTAFGDETGTHNDSPVMRSLHPAKSLSDRISYDYVLISSHHGNSRQGGRISRRSH